MTEKITIPGDDDLLDADELTDEEKQRIQAAFNSDTHAIKIRGHWIDPEPIGTHQKIESYEILSSYSPQNIPTTGYLFHGTCKSRVDGICEDGILPSCEHGHCTFESADDRFSYFTTNVQTAEHFAGRAASDRQEEVVCRVPISSFDKECEFILDPAWASGDAFMTTCSAPSEDVECQDYSVSSGPDFVPCDDWVDGSDNGDV